MFKRQVLMAKVWRARKVYSISESEAEYVNLLKTDLENPFVNRILVEGKILNIKKILKVEEQLGSSKYARILVLEDVLFKEISPIVWKRIPCSLELKDFRGSKKAIANLFSGTLAKEDNRLTISGNIHRHLLNICRSVPETTQRNITVMTVEKPNFLIKALASDIGHFSFSFTDFLNSLSFFTVLGRERQMDEFPDVVRFDSPVAAFLDRQLRSKVYSVDFASCLDRTSIKLIISKIFRGGAKEVFISLNGNTPGLAEYLKRLPYFVRARKRPGQNTYTFILR